MKSEISDRLGVSLSACLSAHVINLWKVQDITCKFGIIGRIFGFGDLEIESAETYGKIIFSFIASPLKRKEEIIKLF